MFILWIFSLDERSSTAFQLGKRKENFEKQPGAKSGRKSYQILAGLSCHFEKKLNPPLPQIRPRIRPEDSGRILTWHSRSEALTGCFLPFYSTFATKISHFFPGSSVSFERKKPLHFPSSILSQILSFHQWFWKLLHTRVHYGGLKLLMDWF